ncbi:MAG: protein kinase [Fuerstiella sp.]
MSAADNDTDPNDEQLFAEFIAAEEARFRGEKDWADSGRTKLPHKQQEQLKKLLHRVRLLQQAGSEVRSSNDDQNSSHEAGQTEISSLEQSAGRPAAGKVAAEGSAEGNPDESGATTPADPTSSVPPTRHVAQYELQKLLGHGGFGVIFQARDTSLQRIVALKIPRVETVLSPAARHRFLHEARAAATLQHPNIVAVYETVEEPEPAIVYELCDHGSLKELTASGENRLTEKESVRLIILVCEGLQHAHARGVLHRDIKPSNILLCSATDQHPQYSVQLNGQNLVPKLTDFGLAKLLEHTDDDTQTSLIIGSPGFMAPEQAAGRRADIGTHTDVFSVGAVLYWMLTGRKPIEGRTPAESLLLLQTNSVIPPRRLSHWVSREVDHICCRCLQPDISDRYDSVAALLQDLRAWQRGEPVSVRAPTPMAVARQFRRQHPRGFMAMLFAVMALIAGLILEFRHNRAQQTLLGDLDAANTQLQIAVLAADAAATRAVQQSRQYQELLYAADIKLADRARVEGDLGTSEAILKRHIPQDGEDDLRDIEWSLLWREIHSAPVALDTLDGAGYCISFSPDGRYFAVGAADETVRIFDAATWQRLAVIRSPQQEVNGVAFSPDAALVASAGDDGTIRLWDWQRQRQVHSVTVSAEKAFGVGFTPDGSRFFGCGNSPEIEWWNTADASFGGVLTGHEDTVETFSISDDGRYLYSASADFTRGVFDLRDNRQLETRKPIHSQRVNTVDGFRLDGRYLFLSGMIGGRTEARSALVVEEAGTERSWLLPSASDDVQSVAVSANGRVAACGLRSGEITLFDLAYLVIENGQKNSRVIQRRWMAHEGRIYGLAFHPNGDLLSTGSDGSLRRWQVQNGGQESTQKLSDHIADAALQTQSVSIDESGRMLTAVTTDGRLIGWRLDTNRVTVLAENLPGMTRTWLSPDGGQVAANVDLSTLMVWNIVKQNQTNAPPANDASTAVSARLIWQLPIKDLSSLTWSGPDEVFVVRRRCSTAGELRDAATGTLLRNFPAAGQELTDCMCGVVSPDGRWCVFGNGNSIVCEDLQTKERFLLQGHSSTVTALRFVPKSYSEGSAWLVSGSTDRTLRLWDLNSRQPLNVMRGHQAAVYSIALSPAGRSLISVSRNNEVNIWSLKSGMLLRRGLTPAWIRPGATVPFSGGVVRVDTEHVTTLHIPSPTALQDISN